MRHKVFGRKLGRNKDERRLLFANLVRSIFISGRIRTTLAKAKAVQPEVEKRVTKLKSQKSAPPRFANRTSGFTRIVKLGKRIGDAAEMVFLEFVDAEPVKPEIVKTKKVKETPKIEEAKVVPSKKPKSSKKLK